MDTTIHRFHKRFQFFRRFRAQTFEVLFLRQRLRVVKVIFITKRQPITGILLFDAYGLGQAKVRNMLVERQHTDVVGFGANEQLQLAAVRADVEEEEFAGEVEAEIVMFFLGFGFSAKTFEMVLKGVVPVGSGIAQKLARTIGKPRGEFFVFEVRIGLVDGREKAGVRKFACEG